MRQLAFLVVITLGVASCSEEPKPSQRSYKMGFQNSAPRYDDFDLFIASLELWTSRADAAIVSTEVPWDSLLAGKNPVTYVKNNYEGLVNYYRSKDFELWVYIDPQNGLDRTSDAVDLVAAGKSIADADMQALYRRFVFVMDSVLHPEHLGLALETNLIRTSASPAIYNGVVQAANDAAGEIQAVNSEVKLSVSVQVEHAWGKLIFGPYEGIAQDLVDFPFVDELGLSSYPYFSWDTPGDIPADYYTRLTESTPLPVFVSEGGWSSESYSDAFVSHISTPEEQRQYIIRHHQLLSSVQALAVFQLAFTDIDVEVLPPDVPESIAYFAFIGLVNADLEPKPSLAAWDTYYHFPYQR
jgi:hypothetical protein